MGFGSSYNEMEIDYDKLSIPHNDILKELRENDINFIVTYNKAGRYYGWGGTHPTLDLIIENTVTNLLRLQRCLNFPINKYKNLREGGKISLVNELGQNVLTLWTVVGYRNYWDFKYTELDGYKIISKRDLIDTIKYSPVHMELRAKLGLEEEIWKDDNVFRAYQISVRG